MNLKTGLLNLLIDQMREYKLRYYKKTGISLSPDELIDQYVRLTSIVINDVDYEEIRMRLGGKNAN